MADRSLQTVYLECDIQVGPVRKNKTPQMFVSQQTNTKSVQINKGEEYWCPSVVCHYTVGTANTHHPFKPQPISSCAQVPPHPSQGGAAQPGSHTEQSLETNSTTPHPSEVRKAQLWPDPCRQCPCTRPRAGTPLTGSIQKAASAAA